MAVSLGVSITQNSQDYGANKSNITVVVSATYTNGSFNRNAKNGTLTIDGTTYNFTASFNVNASTAKGTDELFRKTVDVIHNANGSKTVNASAYYETGVSSGNITATASKVLSTIPREAKLVSAPNFTDEQSPEITYTNDAGSGVNSLQACIASEDNTTIYVSYRDVSKTGTSYKFNFTTEERNILRNATPNANKINVKFYLKTVIGDKTYVSTLTKTMTIVNGNPTISPTVKDTNTTTTALTGNSSKLIKFYSNVSASSGAKAIKGATLKSQKITNGSKSVSTSSGTFNAIESNRFVFTATDSRGNTTTNNYDADMVEYIKLSCNFGAGAPDASGKFNLTVRGNYFNGSFGATSNTLSIKYRYAVSGNTMGSWQTMSYSIGNGTYTATANITGLDYKTTYKFEISATDKLATITKSKEIKSTPIFDWSGEDFNFNVPVSMSYGFNNDSEWTNLNIRSGFSVYQSSNNNIPKCKKCGSVITITGCLTSNSTFTSSTDEVEFFYGIPDDCCPDTIQYMVCQGSGLNRWLLAVKPDGTASMARYGTNNFASVSNGVWLPFTITYQV